MCCLYTGTSAASSSNLQKPADPLYPIPGRIAVFTAGTLKMTPGQIHDTMQVPVIPKFLKSFRA
jgi:hypothetical protein